MNWAVISKVAWLCLLAFMSACSWAENLRVSVVLSDDSTPYQAFSASLKQNISNLVLLSEFKSLSDFNRDHSQPDLVIAIGIKAMHSAISSNPTALLGVMIPKQGYESLLERRSKAISAIYLDQPNDRQLDFIQAALPSARNIGMLYSSGMDQTIAPWRKSIAARGMSLNAFSVSSSSDLYPELDTVLDDIDLLLVIPDSQIYNGSSIRNILLTSYRHNVPLIGISPAYVQAGALCAIFSTPEELARQTVGIITSFEISRLLPTPMFPSSFSIETNQQVARSLGLRLESPEQIRKRMKNTEKGAQ